MGLSGHLTGSLRVVSTLRVTHNSLVMMGLTKRWCVGLAGLILVPVTLLICGLDPASRARPNAEPSKPGAKTAERSKEGHKVASLDSDSDGIPDAAELSTFTDRNNFRRWFTFISEMQFYKSSDEWNAEQRDCAGLVRFAWREALRRHDRKWLHRMGPGYELVASDVAGYQLSDGPLGEKLFRTHFGSYQQTDLVSARFSEFADARTLKNFNSEFLSRDRRQAEPGDLLFFYQPWVQKFPYHVMVFLGDSHLNSDESDDWVVYHTGASPTDEGQIKKVRLSVLDQHPNKRWRPTETNPNFLGFYRLKILQ